MSRMMTEFPPNTKRLRFEFTLTKVPRTRRLRCDDTSVMTHQ